jgi:hypothetical protein
MPPTLVAESYHKTGAGACARYRSAGFLPRYGVQPVAPLLQFVKTPFLCAVMLGDCGSGGAREKDRSLIVVAIGLNLRLQLPLFFGNGSALAGNYAIVRLA